MNKFWIVLSHTYLSRLKTKSFIFTTALTILLIVAVGNIQTIIESFGGDEVKKVAVIDDSNQLYDSLNESIQVADSDIELENYDGSVEEAQELVSKEELAGLLHITFNDEQIPEATYYANKVSTAGETDVLEQNLQQLKVAISANNAGIDPATVQGIFAPVSFEKVSLEENAKTEAELSTTRGIVYVMLFMLYIAVIMYGNMIAMDIANEKASRVMEILISSMPPVSQMFAKIFGVALLGITQVGIFVVAGYAMLTMKKDELTGGIFEYFGLANADVSTFVYAIVFFLLGYLLYATLSAMLGSLVSRMEEINQMMAPVIYLIMIAFFIAMFGLNNPESQVVTITSYIPFFTPMLMFLRVGMLDIPAWEIAASIGIMIASIALLGMIGSRVYRGGVLMYGKSASIKDFKKAFELSKKDK
ncbi:ABC transporter permease [Radiobacillus kanasensis]|uniref:ABC transporter permease n=1 Tax=Radiobacillus kanasensis TaxID=2844358 RepID=UPI001E2C964D|nr:ABC transporter permease [Radiobacillus kanasensis]UFU00472.1 ABC transporter permease [Radiobacillus kanasensis]